MTTPNDPNPNAVVPPAAVRPAPGPGALAPLVPGADADLTDRSYTIDINPMDPPALKTLVYSPDVQILIARGNKQYDVSKDIVACSVQRNENAVSTLVFRLANKADGPRKELRYNQRFERMDRVVCFMKRVKWVQVFSGYLDMVPHVQLYPGTVDFRASCTLKRIIHTWWDPGLAASSNIFNQAQSHLNEIQDGELSLDAGAGSLLRNFLVKVGGWDPSNIHIQTFPTTYFAFMEMHLRKVTKATEEDVRRWRRLILGDGDISGGRGASAGRQLNVSRGPDVKTAPERKLQVMQTVDEMGMGPDTRQISAAQGITTASAKGTDKKDKEAWTETQETGRNWETEGKNSDAAVHCFMTVMAESSWQMYANNAVPESLTFPYDAIGRDGTSVGLFQQTEGNNWGSVAERMNTKASAGMFLKRLNGMDWRNMDRATACQAVQGSAFSDGSNYATHESTAEQEVRELRGNMAPASGASPTTGDAQSGAFGNELNAVTVPGLNGAPDEVASAVQAPSATPNPASPAVVNSVRTKFDTQGAILFARTQLGKPYEFGADGPDSYDCSSFTQWCYKSIDMSIGRDTYTQKRDGTVIPFANIQPGDLIQPHSDHTAMFTGGATGVEPIIIEAPSSGQTVIERPIWFDVTSATVIHMPSAHWGGPGPAPFNPMPVGPGYSPGTAVGAQHDSVQQTGSTEPIARNLFSFMFTPGDFADESSAWFGGTEAEKEKAFVNDQSMIQTVVAMANAGLRKFCSAPNGDFVAYYPDYFGADGKGAVLKLNDIEMKNVQINLNDDALATHVYVGGSQSVTANGILGWFASKGFATVENEFLFKKMTQAAPETPGNVMTSGKEIMKRFGMRPMVNAMPMLQSGAMEFMVAVQIFMEKWAEQYSTNIELTFMPELFPGMRIELEGHDLQVYVAQVTHNCDFEQGFTTSATVMAPSNSSFGHMISNWIDVISQNNGDLTALLGEAASWMF